MLTVHELGRFTIRGAGGGPYLGGVTIKWGGGSLLRGGGGVTFNVLFLVYC